MLPEIPTDESDPRFHQQPPIGQPQHPQIEDKPAVATPPESVTTDDTPESLA